MRALAEQWLLHDFGERGSSTHTQGTSQADRALCFHLMFNSLKCDLVEAIEGLTLPISAEGEISNVLLQGCIMTNCLLHLGLLDCVNLSNDRYDRNHAALPLGMAQVHRWKLMAPRLHL